MTKILVIDDEPMAAEEMAETLEAAGFIAQWSSDPFEALAQAVDPAIRLVVTDLRMPGLDGEQLMAQLRASRDDLNFIVVSGNSSETEKIGRSAAITTQRLSKPVAGEQLIACVRRALS